MSEPQLVAGVVETLITDEALHTAHEAAEPVIDEDVTPAILKSVRTAYLLAKEASVAQDETSRRIVQAQRNKQTSLDEECYVVDKQTTLFDF